MNAAIVEYKASDGQQVKLTPSIVTKFIVSGNGTPSDKEIFSFMAQCQARGLNPLAKDCYMTTFRTANGGTSVSVITSKDYFVRTANMQPTFDGMEAGVVVKRKDGELEYREGCLVGGQTERLVGGWAAVYDKRRSHPSKAVVSLDEYDQHRSLWKSKPATMIRKVALVQALREAYPEQFGGVYDGSEMPSHETPEVVDAVDAGDEYEARQSEAQGDCEASCMDASQDEYIEVKEL